MPSWFSSTAQQPEEAPPPPRPLSSSSSRDHGGGASSVAAALSKMANTSTLSNHPSNSLSMTASSSYSSIWHEVTIDVLGIAGAVIIPSSTSVDAATPTLLQQLLTSSSSSSSSSPIRNTSSSVRAVVAVVQNRKSHGTSGLSEPLRVVASTPSSSSSSKSLHAHDQQRYVAQWSSSSSPPDEVGGTGRRRRARFQPSTISFDAKLRSSATEKIDLMVSLIDCSCSSSETTSTSAEAEAAAAAAAVDDNNAAAAAAANLESSVAAVPVGVCSFRIAAAEWRQTNRLILDIPFHYLQQSNDDKSSHNSHRHPQCRDFPDVRVRKSDLPPSVHHHHHHHVMPSRGGDEAPETTPTLASSSPPPPPPSSSPTRRGGGLMLKRMFSNTSREHKKSTTTTATTTTKADRRDDNDVDDSKSTTTTSSGGSGSEAAASCDAPLTDYLKKVPVQEQGGLVRLEIQWKRKDGHYCDGSSMHSEDRDCADHIASIGSHRGRGGSSHNVTRGGGGGDLPDYSTARNVFPAVVAASHRRGGASHNTIHPRGGGGGDPDYSSARNVFPAVVAAKAAAGAAAHPSSKLVEPLSKSSNNNAAHKDNQDKTTTTLTMKQDASVAAEQQHHHPGGLIETAPSFGSGFYSISTKGGSEFGGPTYFCSVPAEGQQQQQDRPPTTLDPAKIDIGGRQLQQQDNNVSSRQQQSPPLAPEQVTSITEKARSSTGCMESSICALSDNMQCSASFGMNDMDDDDDVNANNKNGNNNIIKIVGIDPSTMLGVLNNKNSKANNSSPQSVMSLSNAGAGVEMETNSRGFARVAGEASVVEQRSCSPRDSSATVHYASSKSAASSSSCSNTLPLRSESPTRFNEPTHHGSNNNNPPNSSAQSKENERTNYIAGLSPSSSMDALEKALWPLNLSSRRLERSLSPDRDEDAGFEVSLVREFSGTKVQTAPSPDRRTARFANMDSRAQSSHPQLQPSTPNGPHHRFSSLNLRGSMDKGISSSRSSGSNNSSAQKNIMGQEQEDGPPPPTVNMKSSDASTLKGYSPTMNSLFSSAGVGLGYPLTSFTRSSSSNRSGGSSSILADKEQKVVGGILRNKPTSFPHAAHNSDVKSASKVQKLAPLGTPRIKFLREQSADMSLLDAPYTTDLPSFMRDLLMFHNKNEGSNNTTKRQKSVRFHPSVVGKVESQFDDESRQFTEYDDDSDKNTLETKETSKSNNPPLWMRVMNKLVHGRSLESDRYQGRSSSYPSQSGAITRFHPQVGRIQESESDWMPNLDWVGMPGILDRDEPWTNYEDDSTWGTLETKESLARPRDDMSLVPLPEDFLYHETYYGCGMRIAKYYDRIFEDNGHGYQGRRQPVPIILLNDMLDERIQQKRGFDQFDDNSIASSRGHGPVSI